MSDCGCSGNYQPLLDRVAQRIEKYASAKLQPEKEQEPVAWFTEDHREDKSATTYSKKMAERWKEKGWPVTPLYTAPPQREWKGLTDEEIEKLFIWQEWSEDFAEYEPVARAIEAKLKEKNT